MSDLVGNPEDRFSRGAAQLVLDNFFFSLNDFYAVNGSNVYNYAGNCLVKNAENAYSR